MAVNQETLYYNTTSSFNQYDVFAEIMSKPNIVLTETLSSRLAQNMGPMYDTFIKIINNKYSVNFPEYRLWQSLNFGQEVRTEEISDHIIIGWQLIEYALMMADIEPAEIAQLMVTFIKVQRESYPVLFRDAPLTPYDGKTVEEATEYVERNRYLEPIQARRRMELAERFIAELKVKYPTYFQ